jgi:hypothetical protein
MASITAPKRRGRPPGSKNKASSTQNAQGGSAPKANAAGKTLTS